MAVPDDLRRRVRHDLRSPLAVILGRVEMLLAEVSGPLTEAQRRSLHTIARNAERLDQELAVFADDLEQLDR